MLDLWQHVARLDRVFALLKTQTVYRLVFGSVGRGTVVGTPLLLCNPHCVHLGRGVLVRAGARFDLVTERSGRHFTPRVVIGDGCSFEQNFHLACATEIIFEDHVAVTENVGVFDILHPYEDVTLPIGAQPLRVAPVRIGTGSLLGMGSVVQPGVTIGAHCLIGANAVVTHDIPPFSVAVGAPARVVRRYDHERGAWVAP